MTWRDPVALGVRVSTVPASALAAVGATASAAAANGPTCARGWLRSYWSVRRSPALAGESVSQRLPAKSLLDIGLG
jgi:hypothetical protein